MYKCLVTSLLLSGSTILSAQPIPPAGGGEFIFRSVPCISDELRASIVSLLDANLSDLERQGKIRPVSNRTSAQLFDWPLRQSTGMTDPGYYGISNFVDQDTSFPGKVLDYNCGARSYDQASGYNHQGTDIFTWPFPRYKQLNNQVQVIAAQEGIIIGKVDGNPDNSCALCTNCNWNAIYIRHPDGSVAWYGHLKRNMTLKVVGENVAKGEFLGVVGSSGNSTGPHLHFEVYQNSTYTLANRIDPFAGPCNRLNGNNTWWAVQKPYREPMINRLVTHFAPPVFGTCPDPETPNDRSVFLQGDTVFFAAYYRDQQQGATTQYTVLRPDGSTFVNWTGTSPSTYNASYWYWSYVLPVNAPMGNWVFRTVFNGVTDVVNFSVNPRTPTAVVDLPGGQYIRLFPNPGRAHEPMHIDWQLNGAASQALDIRVYDVNGRLTGKTQRVNRPGKIVLPDMSGTYIVEVSVSQRETYRMQVIRQ